MSQSASKAGRPSASIASDVEALIAESQSASKAGRPSAFAQSTSVSLNKTYDEVLFRSQSASKAGRPSAQRDAAEGKYDPPNGVVSIRV